MPGPAFNWIAGDQARNIGGGGGAPRSDGNGGYYRDSNGNGVKDDGETMVGYYEVRNYYSRSISTIYNSNQDIGIGGLSYKYDGQNYGGYYYTQSGKVFATAVTESFYSNGGLVGVAGAVAKVTLYFDQKINSANCKQQATMHNYWQLGMHNIWQPACTMFGNHNAQLWE